MRFEILEREKKKWKKANLAKNAKKKLSKCKFVFIQSKVAK